jgi:flagellar biosynthesis protein FliQ
VDLAALSIEALQLVLWLSLPVLLACFSVAAVTSLLQGALQASDPSLSFAPKLLAALGALWLSHTYVANHLLAFASKVMLLMRQLG